MAMANHWSALAPAPVRRIRATGGASRNREILQVMAGVFGADVHPASSTSGASLGGALRALQAHQSPDWSEAVRGFTEPSGAPVRPVPAHTAIYEALRRRYAEAEGEAVDSR